MGDRTERGPLPGDRPWLRQWREARQTLVRLGLVDEYRFFVYPAYSPGATWYGELETQQTLELIGSTAFESGAVALYYKPTAST
ncbi:hypothetical protein ACGFIF_28610 [Kribbella sp. NPDC049174]|uniref:hypothetical protein n=1 Tax=Kribbella sp. NPDC049174 TaxID=3364112 RepID=UPI0037101334